MSMSIAEVRVCTHELPPHTMMSPDGPDGFATEVLKEVALVLKWDLKISYTTWARLLARSKEGECDLVYTILKKDEYLNDHVFPEEPLHIRRNVLLVLNDSKITYNGNLKDFMSKYSIGTYYDKAVSKEFDLYKKEPWAKVDYSNKPEENFLKLLNSRFDAAIENDYTAYYYLNKIDKAHLVKKLNPPINTTPAYVAFSKNGLMLKEISKFSNALRDFKKSKKFQQIEKRYLE